MLEHAVGFRRHWLESRACFIEYQRRAPDIFLIYHSNISIDSPFLNKYMTDISDGATRYVDRSFPCRHDQIHRGRPPRPRRDGALLCAADGGRLRRHHRLRLARRGADALA
ncbi:hypothetical protein MES4922_100142 [Mesorhizobium ventifaucium]|uniref:Uncharacterized protein n=1 Tax=Mesorhizobium ventifaucium TaxID=666020 RepID=A0ABN8JB97_9HYPH|nr:hypothetical protein MES4922_100142 [Mesorhizobium ventifaucium]